MVSTCYPCLLPVDRPFSTREEETDGPGQWGGAAIEPGVAALSTVLCRCLPALPSCGSSRRTFLYVIPAPQSVESSSNRKGETDDLLDGLGAAKDAPKPDPEVSTGGTCTFPRRPGTGL